MKCPKCQFENPKGMKYCGECGSRLERICPSCNLSNPADFKFCGECGFDLKKAEEACPADDLDQRDMGVSVIKGDAGSKTT